VSGRPARSLRAEAPRIPSLERLAYDREGPHRGSFIHRMLEDEMPFRLGPTELILILLIALLLFGPGRLSNLARELGQSIREFRRGLTSEEEKGETKPDKPS